MPNNYTSSKPQSNCFLVSSTTTSKLIWSNCIKLRLETRAVFIIWELLRWKHVLLRGFDGEGLLSLGALIKGLLFVSRCATYLLSNIPVTVTSALQRGLFPPSPGFLSFDRKRLSPDQSSLCPRTSPTCLQPPGRRPRQTGDERCAATPLRILKITVRWALMDWRGRRSSKSEG